MLLSWAHLLGFLIGAVIGVIATDANPEQIRPAARKNGHHRENHLVGILFVGAIWILLVILLYFCRAASANAERDFILGSTIGVIAAPWVWLHFARSLRPTQEGSPPPISPDENFQRYKFLTIILGIALLGKR